MSKGNNNKIQKHDAKYKKYKVGKKVTDKEKSSQSAQESFSNASNYHAFGHQVNPRTGVLQITILPPALSGFLGQNITPSISYQQQSIASGNSFLGLPLGWYYQFSFIYKSQVHVNGQSAYYIDDSYDSGLRYYNLKNLRFTNDTGVFPYDSSLQYTNVLQFLNGENQYFDTNGRLIGIDDRWGNHVIFYYNRSGDVYSSKISKIVNSYGKNITFMNFEQGIKITYPNGEQNSIEFTYLVDADSYLTGYVDPLGQKYTITNNGGLSRTDLISQVTQPNGLVIDYDYTTMRYYLGNKMQFYRLDCVATVKETYGGDTRTTVYDYDYNQDAHNYTGYPTYVTAGNEDTLLQSNDNEYRYVTRIDDGVLVTEHIYNRLHLELETKVYTKDTNPILIKETINTYKDETDDGLFPPYYELKLVPNYQTPVKVVTNVYNDIGDKLVDQIEFEFDDYGLPIERKSYRTTTLNESPILFDKVRTTYDNLHYGEIIQEDSYDYTDLKLSTPVIRRKINTLTSDNKNVATSVDGFVVSEDNGDIFHADKKFTYKYNELGKIIFEKLEWADNKDHLLQSTETSISYIIDHSVLKIISTNAQNISKTTVLDTTTGWVVSKIDALGNSVSYTYDNIGRKLTETDQLGVITKWSFEDTINKTTIKYPNGYEKYSYNNGFGENVKIADNCISKTKERILEAAAYNNKGQKIWAEKILGINSRVVYGYNNRGQLSTTTDPLGNVRRFEYDPCTQIKTEYFNDVKVNTLKKDNNVLQEEFFSNSSSTDYVTTISSYNAYSKIFRSTLGDKSVEKQWIETSYLYDVNNKISNYNITGYDNISASHDISRDLFGNLILESTNLTAPGGVSSFAQGDLYSYNNLNQLVTITNNLNQNYTYTYNSVGLLSSYMDYAGNVFSCKYYANNQLSSLEWQDINKVQCKIEYTYDPLMYQLQKIEEFHDGVSQNCLSYTYSIDGKIESITYTDGKQILYEYDNTTGLLNKVVDAAQKQIQYSYDQYGRVLEQKIVGTDYSLIIDYYDKTVSKNDSGRVKSIKISNGILRNYTYNGYGDILQVSITDTTVASHDNVLLNTEYVYDDTTRNIVKMHCSSTASPQDSNLNYTANYTYNTLNQLVSEIVQDANGNAISNLLYTYDAVGNVIRVNNGNSADDNSTIYTYDKDNKLLSIKTSAGIRKLVYDINGNLIDNGQGCTYSYDSQNKLISYKDSINNLYAEYTYYPNGLRASKKVNNDEAIQFYYDNSQYPNILNESQGDKTSSYLMTDDKRYIRLLSDKESTVPEYFIESFRDIVGITNNSNKLETSYAYESYGQEKTAIAYTNSDISVNPFRYTAEYKDSESGLIYLRKRYYNPEIKRFISKDNAMLLNLYNYANGNPVMYVDPSGNVAKWVNDLLGGITIALGAATLFGGFAVGSPYLMASGALAMVSGATAIAANHTSGKTSEVLTYVSLSSGIASALFGMGSIASAEFVASTGVKAALEFSGLLSVASGATGIAAEATENKTQKNLGIASMALSAAAFAIGFPTARYSASGSRVSPTAPSSSDVDSTMVHENATNKFGKGSSTTQTKGGPSSQFSKMANIRGNYTITVRNFPYTTFFTGLTVFVPIIEEIKK